MIIRALDPQNDWKFGHGLADFNFNQDAIAENLQTRLASFQNDLFWALGFGVDWWDLLSSANPAAQNGILAQTRLMILGNSAGYPSFGVTGINSVNFSQDARTRRISIQYNVRTIYSTSATGTVTLPIPGGG